MFDFEPIAGGDHGLDPAVKKEAKPKPPDLSFGYGIEELSRRQMSQLSENKKLGVAAHQAFNHAYEEAAKHYVWLAMRDNISLREAIEKYPEVLKKSIDRWREEWGHIPGWWNRQGGSP